MLLASRPLRSSALSLGVGVVLQALFTIFWNIVQKALFLWRCAQSCQFVSRSASVLTGELYPLDLTGAVLLISAWTIPGDFTPGTRHRHRGRSVPLGRGALGDRLPPCLPPWLNSRGSLSGPQVTYYPSHAVHRGLTFSGGRAPRGHSSRSEPWGGRPFRLGVDGTGLLQPTEPAFLRFHRRDGFLHPAVLSAWHSVREGSGPDIPATLPRSGHGSPHATTLRGSRGFPASRPGHPLGPSGFGPT